MTPQTLRNEMDAFMLHCAQRILGPGKEQYFDALTGQQAFETMSIDELFASFQEELYDIAVYSVMLSIRLDRMKQALERLLEEKISDGPR